MNVNVDYAELKKAIDGAKVSYGYQFEYQERTFNIFPHKHTRQNEKDGENPAFWQDNSSLGDYDIYIATNLVKKKFRKPVLLHETLEAFLQEGFCKGFDKETAIDMAHKIATEYDKLYARKTLNGELFEEYLQLRKRLTGFLAR
ncbi:hypothetical protein HOA92_06075 [archaeon]|jgi:hypothetical protein|nr:hypothetical protein [archaeon]MBT6762578.1 hypothetical protein [archaeon]